MNQALMLSNTAFFFPFRGYLILKSWCLCVINYQALQHWSLRTVHLLQGGRLQERVSVDSPAAAFPDSCWKQGCNSTCQVNLTKGGNTAAFTFSRHIDSTMLHHFISSRPQYYCELDACGFISSSRLWNFAGLRGSSRIHFGLLGTKIGI
jgi:hypothetical protein